MPYNERMNPACKRARVNTRTALVALAIGVLLMVVNLAACSQQSGSTSSATREVKEATSSASSASSASGSSATPKPDAENALACIGDSITFGSGIDHPERDAWPALLQEKLGASWHVANLGMPGAMLLNESSSPYRSTGYVERALDLDPSVAIIMLGTNDSADPSWNADSYHAQLEALGDEITQASTRNVQIVLMAPPCTFFSKDNVWHRDPTNSLIGNEIRSIVKQVAADKGTRYLDLFAFTENHPEWFPDELHPDETGNQAIADYIYEQVF